MLVPQMALPSVFAKSTVKFLRKHCSQYNYIMTVYEYNYSNFQYFDCCASKRYRNFYAGTLSTLDYFIGDWHCCQIEILKEINTWGFFAVIDFKFIKY